MIGHLVYVVLRGTEDDETLRTHCGRLLVADEKWVVLREDHFRRGGVARSSFERVTHEGLIKRTMFPTANVERISAFEVSLREEAT